MGLVVSLFGAYARAPPVDYADKLPLNPWYIFAPQRRYIIPPPLTRYTFKTHAEVRMAIFEFIEDWYNPHRRHSSLGQQSPVNYESKYQQAA